MRKARTANALAAANSTGRTPDMTHQTTFNFGGETPRESFATKRDFHGYAQFRESEAGPWRFYVSGFDSTTSGNAGQCALLRTGGNTEWVPIDETDRITIAGRKYGRELWDH